MSVNKRVFISAVFMNQTKNSTGNKNICFRYY